MALSNRPGPELEYSFDHAQGTRPKYKGGFLRAHINQKSPGSCLSGLIVCYQQRASDHAVSVHMFYYIFFGVGGGGISLGRVIIHIGEDQVTPSR